MIDQALLNKLLRFGVERGASDIHFRAGGPPRYRIQGELLKAKFDPLTPEDTLAIGQILLAERKIDLAPLFREQDTSYCLPGVSRFRVTVFRQRGTVGCVLRVVPLRIQTLEDLNLPPVVQDIAESRRGLILVTGPTGVGKSTTIAAMLQHVNENRAAHILTIEDPIEFLFEDARGMFVQREVGSDTYSYAEAMTAALRSDPDIIMLGEVRDEASAAVCLKAAETGHLVITTLHTPDAVTTVKRFVALFSGGPDAALGQLGRFAECLQAIISLRLLPRADKEGLIPAAEIVRVTHGLKDLIRDPARHPEIPGYIASARTMYGMQTFDQHLVDLVQSGRVHLDMAKLAATVPDDVERAVVQGGSFS